MKSIKPVSVLLGIVITIISGCYPKGPENIEDYDLVITNHDTSFNFQSLKTYALPDTIVKITGNRATGQAPEIVSPVYASNALATIRNAMNNYGWTEVNKHNNPNVIMLPSVVQSTTDLWYNDNGYWDWYYPPSNGGGWYYPYPIYTGSYTTGTLIIQMIYPAGITAVDNIPVIWLSLMNGLFEGSTTDINARVAQGIERAFENSPYLNLKPK